MMMELIFPAANLSNNGSTKLVSHHSHVNLPLSFALTVTAGKMNSFLHKLSLRCHYAHSTITSLWFKWMAKRNVIVCMSCCLLISAPLS